MGDFQPHWDYRPAKLALCLVQEMGQDQALERSYRAAHKMFIANLHNETLNRATLYDISP